MISHTFSLKTNKPLFSLVYMTYRPGGIDLLAESLANQPSIYELIVVDNYPGRIERRNSINYIRDRKIPLRFYGGPSIPVEGEPKRGIARAINAGAVQATTNKLIFLEDLCWLPPGWAYQWEKVLGEVGDKQVTISATSSLRLASPPDIDDDISIWKQKPCWLNIQHEIEVWKPYYIEGFHSYYPIKFFEDINGFDERGGAEEWGASLFFQLQSLGYESIVDDRIRIGMVNHRAWGGPKWTTENPKKITCEASMPLNKISPNPYNFKELRKNYTSVVGEA